MGILPIALLSLRASFDRMSHLGAKHCLERGVCGSSMLWRCGEPREGLPGSLAATRANVCNS